jgi:hypothetical protein
LSSSSSLIDLALCPVPIRINLELRISYTAGRGINPVARLLPTQDNTKQTHKKRGQTSMPRVGFEPPIPVSERAKTFHALGCAATVMIQLTDLKRCGTVTFDTSFALLWTYTNWQYAGMRRLTTDLHACNMEKKGILCQPVASYDYSTKRRFWLNLAWDHLLQHRLSPSKAKGLFHCTYHACQFIRHFHSQECPIKPPCVLRSSSLTMTNSLSTVNLLRQSLSLTDFAGSDVPTSRSSSPYPQRNCYSKNKRDPRYTTFTDVLYGAPIAQSARSGRSDHCHK